MISIRTNNTYRNLNGGKSNVAYFNLWQSQSSDHDVINLWMLQDLLLVNSGILLTN